MAKIFRKKPVAIEAIQWIGSDECWNEIKEFAYKLLDKEDFKKDKIICLGEQILIKTLEGDMKADRGDWIIKGVNGEFYPCKPDIFEKTYEEVDDSRFSV